MWSLAAASFLGNYTRALDDFQECLKLQVKHLDADSRLLAETHYHLGLTYSLNLQYSQAIKELNSSISVIKSRLGKQELCFYSGFVNVDRKHVAQVIFLSFLSANFSKSFKFASC